MSIHKVKKYFAQYGVENKILEFDTSSATVELAAAAIGCEPARIAKTLSFRVGDEYILIVTAGDAKIDNARYKSAFGTKAKMLTPDEAILHIGHAVGGVCPFAVKEGVKIFLDESLKRFSTVYPACGSNNSAIELDIPQLERFSKFTAWVDVCSCPSLHV